MTEQAALDPSLAWMIILAFGVLWVVLGWWLGRNNKNLEDYMLAGRKVGLGLAVATAMATWVTSNTTMTAPQLAYQLGIWGMVGYSFGAVGLLLFAPLARRIRTLMPHGYTSGDFIRLRYGSVTWRIFLLISLFYSFGWLISLGMAGGILVQSLTGIPYAYGMSVMIAMCTAYTVFGGLRAVIGTDFIQTVLIVIGVSLLAALVIDEVGFEAIHTTLRAERPELLNLLFPAAIMFLFNNLFFGVGEIFHSNVWWSRAFAFERRIGFRAYLLAGIFWLPIPVVAGLLALAAPALQINVPMADMVAPLVASKLFGIWGAILVFVVVFAALASSLDSLLAATSDLILKDIYKGHLRPSATDEQLKTAARLVIVGLGVMTWMLCLPRLGTLASLLHFTGAFVASTIWPIAFGLLYRRGNGHAAGWAMVLGTGSGLIGYYTIGFYVAALISAATSLLVMAVLSWGSATRFNWNHLNEENVETLKGSLS
ncbi:sodium:solute symporter family protein [Luteithermobacter gelatinilyticus]|uniref:sodium:solute symporter family protein n=1 Tax=Luteithermobacter gelatinilyticus TaxID=2582913 RepID=UPI001106BB8C|nr:sodium:solute symporter family protein [Luteithermobacter gelatinilyticus]